MGTVRKAHITHDDGWIALQAAADALGVTRTKTLALIVKGDLVGKHIANRTVVRRDTVDALIAARSETSAA